MVDPRAWQTAFTLFNSLRDGTEIIHDQFRDSIIKVKATNARGYWLVKILDKSFLIHYTAIRIIGKPNKNGVYKLHCKQALDVDIFTAYNIIVRLHNIISLAYNNEFVNVLINDYKINEVNKGSIVPMIYSWQKGRTDKINDDHANVPLPGSAVDFSGIVYVHPGSLKMRKVTLVGFTPTASKINSIVTYPVAEFLVNTLSRINNLASPLDWDSNYYKEIGNSIVRVICPYFWWSNGNYNFGWNKLPYALYSKSERMNQHYNHFHIVFQYNDMVSWNTNFQLYLKANKEGRNYQNKSYILPYLNDVATPAIGWINETDATKSFSLTDM